MSLLNHINTQGGRLVLPSLCSVFPPQAAIFFSEGKSLWASSPRNTEEGQVWPQPGPSAHPNRASKRWRSSKLAWPLPTPSLPLPPPPSSLLPSLPSSCSPPLPTAPLHPLALPWGGTAFRGMSLPPQGAQPLRKTLQKTCV